MSILKLENQFWHFSMKTHMFQCKYVVQIYLDTYLKFSITLNNSKSILSNSKPNKY